MFLNGLVTGVHSSADNIVAVATQYSVDIGASQKKKKDSQFSHPIEKLFFFGEFTWDKWQNDLGGEKIGHATKNAFL